MNPLSSGSIFGGGLVICRSDATCWRTCISCCLTASTRSGGR